MKILRVVSTIHPAQTGITQAALQASRAMKRQGAQVTIISIDSPETVHRFQPTGLPLEVIGGGPGIGKYRFSLRFLRTLLAESSLHDVLIIDGTWRFHGLATLLAAKYSRTPYVIYPHGSLNRWVAKRYPFKHLKKLIYWLLFERLIFRHAAAVIFTHEVEAREARETFPCARWHSEVRLLGVEDPSLLPAGMDLPRPADLPEGPYVVFFGRLTEKKQPDLALRAFAESGLQVPVSLVFVGQDEGWAKPLKAIAEQLGIAHRVKVLGARYDSRRLAYIRHAECLLLPSHQENFSMAAAESLSFGTPVLISRHVNIARLVDRAGAGIVFDTTIASCAKALRAFFGLSAAARSDMKNNARGCFERYFEAENSAASILGLLHRLGRRG